MTTELVSSVPLEQREQFVHDWFEVSDAQTFTRFGEYLSADVEFTFGNAETIHGLAAVVAVGVQMKDDLASTVHEIVHVHTAADGRHSIAELRVTYTRHDARMLTIPGASVLGFDAAGLISEYRIYADQADLYA